MTNSKLQALVADAVFLDKHIAEKTEQLKAIKKQLIDEAKTRKDEYTRTEGGGRSWVATAPDGNIARVTFPGRKLKSTVNDDDIEKMYKLLKSAPGAWPRLFGKDTRIFLREDFRENAARLLGDDAPSIIKICESKSSPTVSFETKEKAE